MARRDRKSVQEPGSWVMVRKAMKESPAWRALPDNARRVLDRLEVEHMRHAGREHGRLVCTYSDFKLWGIRKSSVALAIRQCVALGFLEITRAGYKSAAEFRVPSTYRLTYVWGRDKATGKPADPTDEWERLATEEQAKTALEAASRTPSGNIDRRPDSGPSETLTGDPIAGQGAA